MSWRSLVAFAIVGVLCLAVWVLGYNLALHSAVPPPAPGIPTPLASR